MIANWPPILASADTLDWWLGLDRVHWSDPSAMLSWVHPLHAWQWALIMLAAALVSGASYRHLVAGRLSRGALGVVRAILILFVVALLAGPMILVQDPHTEDDWLFMLVDRSESIMLEDALPVDAADPHGQPISRDRALRTALERHRSLFEDEAFTRNRRIVWLGFDERTYEIGPFAVDWSEPEGQATALRTAIEQTLGRAVGRPIAGIVLMTDGQSPQSTGVELALRLKRRGVPVFAVPLGGDVNRLDVSLSAVEAPQKAFVNDDVPIRAWIRLDPTGAAIDPSALTVRLVDVSTGKVLDEKKAPNIGPDRPVLLTGQWPTQEQVNWRVQVMYDPGREAMHADPDARNNERAVSIEMIDRKIRVLYVEGYPRWEYRFLKTLMVREQSIASSIMLASADRDFAQEGDEPITRLPNSPEEFAPYDVVVWGDVPPDYLSQDQMIMLRDHVAVRGAGLLWIGGAYHTPRRYDGSVLADMLPMHRPGAVQRLDSTAEVVMHRWPLADALNVLQLREPQQPEGAATWPADLPPLQWAQDVGTLKRIAEVLAASTPADSDAASAPLVVRMRFGGGQSIYVATDETWRWRYGRGSVFFGQFWTGIIRMLGRARIQQHSRSVRFDVPYARVEVGQNVRVRLTIEDAVLLKRRPSRVAVAVYREDDEQQRPVDQLDLLPTNGEDEDGSITDTEYRADWKPASTGRLVLRVIEPALDDLGITQTIDVERVDAEMLRTQPDHARLARLAEQSGGKVIPLAEFGDLSSHVKSLARHASNPITEPLWDSPLALALILLLLTIEWVGRKIIRLV